MYSSKEHRGFNDSGMMRQCSGLPYNNFNISYLHNCWNP